MNPKSSGQTISDTRRLGVSAGRGTAAAVESENDDMDESGLSEDEDEAGEGVCDEGDGDLASSDECDEEEDSSDMDVSECERKRYEFIEDLTDLEKQFAILREQLYRERITQIEAKLKEVRNGIAQEYLQPLEELQVNMKNRMEVGAILRELRLSNIQCKFEAEQLATEQNFSSEKELLWDAIKEELEEKIHKLEEDKNNVDFCTGLWEQTSGCIKSSRRRKSDLHDSDRRKKPVTVTGPFIVYMLKDSDILDDWTLIKKSLQQQRKKQDRGPSQVSAI